MNTGRRVLRGSAFILAIRAFQRSLGLISTLVLARLLTPADFGIVAIAFIVIHLSGILCNTGARQYLVQVDEIDDDTVNTAWTLDLLFRTVASLLIFACLPLTLLVWNNPSATWAIAALAPTLALEALQNPQLHVDQRNLVYASLVRVEIAKKLVSFAVVIVAAWLTESFWAIVLGNYASVLTAVLVSHQVCERRPRLARSRMGVQWQFSKWMLSRGYIGYLRAQIDVFMVSRLFPVEQLGKFTMAREITIMPATDVIAPATQPLLSSFSRARGDPVSFARQATIAMLAISLLVSPACVYLFLHAEAFVSLALGSRWIESAAMMRTLTPMLFGFALGGLVTSLLIALGRVKTLFWYDAITLALVAAALLVGRGLPLVEFITVRSVISFAVSIGVLIYFARHIGVPVTSSSAALMTPLIAAAATGFVGDAMVRGAYSDGAIVHGSVFTLLYAVTVLGLAAVLRHSSPSWHYLFSLVDKGARRIAVAAGFGP